MGRGLVGAAIASGLGQGLATIGNQGMAYLTAKSLQKDREDFENRRLQLMEGYAAAREQRGYAHSEKMQADQQSFTQSQTNLQHNLREQEADSAVGRKEAADERARTKANDPSRIAEDAVAAKVRSDAGKPLRDELAQEEVGREVDKMTALSKNPDYIDGIKTLTSAKESLSAKAEAAVKTLQARAVQTELDLKDAYSKAKQSGDKAAIKQAEDALQGFVDKPWEDRRHRGTLAAQAMREIGHDLVRYETALNNAMPGSPEAESIKRKISMLDAERQGYAAMVKTSLGMETAPTQPKSVTIIDPRDAGGKQSPGSIMAGQPTAPARPGAPVQNEARDKKNFDAFKSQGNGSGFADNLSSYLKDKPDAVAQAPVERGLIAGQRQESEPKSTLRKAADAVLGFTGNTLLSRSQESPAPSASKDAPTQGTSDLAKQEQPPPPNIEKPKGIIGEAISDEASASIQPKSKPDESFNDLINKLPAEQQESVKQHLDYAVAQYRQDGNLDRLRGNVLTALAGVSDSMENWTAQADALTRALAQQAAPGPQSSRSYESIIQAKADKYGVPPDLLRAVIQAESNFDPNAVGRMTAKGEQARGLMQLMPGTAKDMGLADPFDPDQNVDAGAKYLATLLKRYQGDEDKALAAYNFGLANVDKGAALPAETRNYVAKIRKLRGRE